MGLPSCCILNGGGGAWAFAALADQLGKALWVEVFEQPRDYNYLLCLDNLDLTSCGELFIPYQAMYLASDKRLLAQKFLENGVPIPETRLIASLEEALKLLEEDPDRHWCIKFPTACGASGHRYLLADMALPKGWPLPLVVQEFIHLDRPEVFRTFAANGELFGWVARRFPEGIKPSPWVAHARGARYVQEGEVPAGASVAAGSALEAVGLLESFGCADLLRRPTGEWIVLEVGTDGMFNHVDRDLGLPVFEEELQRRVADAFWARLGDWRPWGSGDWRPREGN